MEKGNQQDLDRDVVGERGSCGKRRNGSGQSEEWWPLKKKVEEKDDMSSSTFSLSVSSHEKSLLGNRKIYNIL